MIEGYYYYQLLNLEAPAFMWCILLNWQHYKFLPLTWSLFFSVCVKCISQRFSYIFHPSFFFSFFRRRVLFAGRDRSLVHPLFPQFVSFWILSNLRENWKCLLPLCATDYEKGISSICCHRSMIAYHQHLFFFFYL